MAPSGHASPAAITATAIVFTVLAGLVVALRIISRIFISRNAGKDDIAISLAMASSIVLGACTALGPRYGLGHHDYEVSPAELTVALKIVYAAILTYVLAMSFTKASILLQYWRIFPHLSFRVTGSVVAAMVLAYAIGSTLSTMLFCVPIEAFWDRSITEKHCLSYKPVWFSQAAANMVTDIAVALLPLPWLWQLRVAQRQRAAYMCVFGLGGFTCIVSILRLDSLYIGATAKDKDWSGGHATIWSVVEVNTGILCSCLPTLKSLVTRYYPNAFSSNQRSESTWMAGNRSSLHAFGEHLGNINNKWTCQLNAMCSASNSLAGKDSLDINAVECANSQPGIQVVTIMEQDVERDGGEGKSDHGSTKRLVEELP